MSRSKNRIKPSGIYPYKILLSCIMFGLMIFTVYLGETAVVSLESQKLQILQDQQLQELLTYQSKKKINIGKALTVNQEFKFYFADYFTFFNSEKVDKQLSKQEKKLILVYLENERTFSILVNTLFSLLDQNQNEVIIDEQWNEFAEFMQENDPEGDFVNQSQQVKQFMKGLKPSENEIGNESEITKAQFASYFQQIREIVVQDLKDEINEDQDYQDQDQEDDNVEEEDNHINMKEVQMELQYGQEEEEDTRRRGRILKGIVTQAEIMQDLAQNMTTRSRKKAKARPIGNVNEITPEQAKHLTWLIVKRRWDIVFKGIFDIFDEDSDLFVHQMEIDDMALILQMNSKFKIWLQSQISLLGLELHRDVQNEYFFSIDEFLIVMQRLRELYQRYIREEIN